MRFFNAFRFFWGGTLGCKATATIHGCLLASLLACEEVVEPSLISADPVLVIDARVSDEIGKTRVLLSNTTAFNNPNPNPKVSGANILIRESENGSIYRFEEIEEGEYRPVLKEFKGIAGLLYALEVRIPREDEADLLYESTSRMPFPVPIDSITYQYEPQTAERDAGYYIFYHHQDPLGKNYHLVEVWKNGVPLTTDRIEIRSDENVKNKYLNLEVPYTFAPNDTVEIRLTSLPADVFSYYEGINRLIESGSPSEAVPENPNNNIESTVAALGFFEVSAARDYRVILPEE